MDKCYVVIEWGGEYEDYWQSVIGVCPTIHLAKTLKKKIEANHTSKISREKFDKMYEEFWNIFETVDEDLDEIEEMCKLFPEFSKDEIESAINCYIDNYSWGGVEIKEINFYKTENDLNYVE